MLATNQKNFILLFKELDDQREDENLTYPLNEILLIIVAAVLLWC